MKETRNLGGGLIGGKKTIISILAKFLNIDKYRISTQGHVLVDV